MALYEYILIISFLFVLGIIIAIPTSMVGLAGGILFTPILIIFFHLPPNNAIAISLMAMLGNTVSCSLSYVIQRRVDYKTAIFYDLLDFPGVWLGAFLTIILPMFFMFIIIGLALFILGASLVLKLNKKKNDESLETPLNLQEQIQETKSFKLQLTTKKTVFILVSSFFGGFVSGLVGLGGGTTDTTTMILLGMSPLIAGPTSEFAMTFTNLLAVIVHGLLGNIMWELAIPMMLGAIIGGQIGAQSQKFSYSSWSDLLGLPLPV
ncbi:MAG: sulfite exporter TauE/SafE family protein [Candidatus Helarchaeota archaeon]